MSDAEVLIELWEITEWRDGAVYKTKLIGERWVDMDDRNRAPKGFIHASISDPNKQTIRRKRSAT